MSLQKCHECGKDVSSEAKSCSNCGAPVKTIPSVQPIQNDPKESSKSKFLVLIGILVTFIIFMILLSKEDRISEDRYKQLVDSYKDKNYGWANVIIDDFRTRNKMNYKNVATIEKEVSMQLQKTEEREKNNFITNIEYNYQRIVDHYKRREFNKANSFINDFKKYHKMDYKDVVTIEKEIQTKLKIMEEKEAIKQAKEKTNYGESCYQLGFRYGRCGTMALKGYQCDSSDDIVMPVECRGLPETDRGTRDGVKSVY